jgi:hypothetical protein
MNMLVTAPPGSGARSLQLAQVTAPSLMQQVGAAVAAGSVRPLPTLTSAAARTSGVGPLLQSAQGFVPEVKKVLPVLTGALKQLDDALPPAPSVQRALALMSPAQKTVVANTALLLLKQHREGQINNATFRAALQQLLQRGPGIAVGTGTPARGSLQTLKPPPKAVEALPRDLGPLPEQRLPRLPRRLEPTPLQKTTQARAELPAEVQKELDALKLEPSRTMQFWDPNDPVQTLMQNIAHASADELEAILGELARHAPLFYKWLMQQPWFTQALADRVWTFSAEQQRALQQTLERIDALLAAQHDTQPQGDRDGAASIEKNLGAGTEPTPDSATRTDDVVTGAGMPRVESAPLPPARQRLGADVMPPNDPTLVRSRNGWEMTYAPQMNALLGRFPGLVVGLAGGRDASGQNVADGLAERLHRDPAPDAQFGVTIDVPAALSRDQPLRLTVQRTYRPHGQSRVVQFRVENLATQDTQDLVLKVEKPELATRASNLLPYPDVVKTQNMLAADRDVAQVMHDNHLRFAQVYMTLDRGAAKTRSPATFLLSEYVHPESKPAPQNGPATTALDRFASVANRKLAANRATAGIVIDNKLNNIVETRDASGQPEYVIVDPFKRGTALDSEGSPSTGRGPSNLFTARRPGLPPLPKAESENNDVVRLYPLGSWALQAGASDAAIAEARIKQLQNNPADVRSLLSLSPQRPLVFTYRVRIAAGSQTTRSVEETIARDLAAGGYRLTVGRHDIEFQLQDGRVIRSTAP